ncbi:MAG: alkane 1-monooxygenase [Schleiferiaceae bacterium]|nr:alkane 1-monooxygenase [Schleiferiaceae bacterium]
MIRPLKYLLVYLLPISAIISFYSNGVLSFAPVILSFVIIPLFEFVLPPNRYNLTPEENKKISKNVLYDWVIYLIVPVQWFCLILFLFSLQNENLSFIDLIGRITAYGMLCGVLGINVAHELGHRMKTSEKFMAKSLLLSACYMQFYIEHNRGHHRNVATPIDPTTARVGETLPAFWLRSISGVYLNAWKISNKEAQKKFGTTQTFKNEMLQYQLAQIALVFLIILFFGAWTGLAFLSSCVMGWLLLETVEYIEHYGLQREKLNEFRFENTNPTHSWNSNHTIGRLFLFELSRHSDHHYLAHKKYPTLDHHSESPQMPTGYPGMMLLATIPPLWFKIMNPKIEQIKKRATY